jgi:hypothetical protein
MHPIEIFFSYAHEDERLMDRIRRQLVVYDRQKKIRKWHDRQILPGQELEKVIDERLAHSQIILLFVSPDFIDSKYCYNIEMEVALRRHEEGSAVVIPIILRPCPWLDTPLSKLNALPKDGKAFTEWGNRDKAALSIAQGIMEVVQQLRSEEITTSAGISGERVESVKKNGMT